MTRNSSLIRNKFAITISRLIFWKQNISEEYLEVVPFNTVVSRLYFIFKF
jgi:hypothetical protein